MSETNHDDLVDAIFDQFKDKQFYIDALRRAAEESYENEMVDTNMEIVSVKEVAENYKYYVDEKEKQEAIDHCEWDTKEQWIDARMSIWLDPKAEW